VTRPAGIRRIPRTDLALAMVLAALALIDALVQGPDEPMVLVVLAALGTTLPVAWRTSNPVLAALVPSAALLTAVLAGDSTDQPTVTTFAPLIGVFALGEHGSARALRVAGPLVVCCWIGTGIADSDAGGTVLGAVGSAAALAVGRAARLMTFETDALEARVGALQSEQEERTRLAIAAERSRIARELHDVIGHSISVMGIQAGAVRRVLPEGMTREREMLEAVERSGRDSVGEMKRLIDLLKASDEVPDAAPPGIEAITGLVEDVRRAGLDVSLVSEGDLAGVAPGRALAVFRIVQESLTNAMKHAPGAKATVRVARAGADIEIEVVSAAGTGVDGAATGGGHGLIGMRERAALYGGRLDAAPTPDGGFAVSARLPAEGA
jgi:signal transduction histidine kinase